tara:strand:+ start:273 stop:668 length:396 start_codon:yes stop_codon:yes gene_type:complete
VTVLNYKCPCCGYSKQTKYNPSREIARLRRKRTKSTRTLLRQVVNKITTNIPSENNITKEFYFYQSISKVSDAEVKYGLNIYLSSNGYYKGKGFKYLTQIILNHNKNKSKMKEFERKMIGKPPSVVKLKED